MVAKKPTKKRQKPVEKGPQSPFSSPSMNRIISVVPRLSPSTPRRQKSPTKDSLFPRSGHSGLSPVKTPKGRAGLRSPAKRSIEDLNNSAVKRAQRTRISARLAQEDDNYSSDDDFEDASYRDEQELAIADSIIRDSRGESPAPAFVSFHGQEVWHEEDLEDHKPSKKSPRAKTVKIPEQEPILETPRESSGSATPLRSKTNEDVWSIFNEEGKNEPELEEPQEKSDLFSIAFDKTSDNVPMISGIPKSQNDEDERTRYTKFTTFPLPRHGLDEELSAEYIKEYLPQIEWDTKRNNITADDRAFYFEGPQGLFDQLSNRERHSVNSLSLLGISLDNKEFFQSLELMKFIKRDEKDSLSELHKTLYHQWSFELSQGFNLCFYGLGSKIEVITDYVANSLISWMEDYYQLQEDQIPKVLVLNGYNPAVKLAPLLYDIIQILVPEEAHNFNRVFGEAFPHLLRTLNNKRSKQKNQSPKLVLVVHCIDGEPLRDNKTQIQLSLLANLPEVRLLCSTEHIAAPLLWDPFKAEHLKFLYHDLTTYEPYIVETSYKDVLGLGKPKKTVSNRGVRFVLSALNANSKKIYNILIHLQIESIKSSNPRSVQETSKGTIKNGVDFKLLHQNCIEQFITANEMNFRSMLGEFTEHNMCNMSKDETGREKLYIPFTVAEMKKILRDFYKEKM